MATATVEVTEYQVCAIPEGLVDRADRVMWSVWVRPTSVPDMWVVTGRHQEEILTLGGNWTWRLPRGFRRQHYRTLPDALAAAKAAAESREMFGMTPDDLIAKAGA